MQIFHDNDERLLLAPLQQHLAQEGKGPRSCRLRTPPGQPCGVRLHFEELEKVRSTLCGIYAYLCEALTYFLNDYLGVVRFRNATIVTDEVKHWDRRERAHIGATVALKIRHLFTTQTVLKLVHEPGLAHAGCADNPHHLAATALDLTQQPVEQCQLLLAAHELTQSVRSRPDPRDRLRPHAQ